MALKFKIKKRPVLATGGTSVQGVNSTAIPTTKPPTLNGLFNIKDNPMFTTYVDLDHQVSINPDDQFVDVGPANLPSAQSLSDQLGRQVAENQTVAVRNYYQGQLEEAKRSQDGNVTDPMQMPYFNPDLTSRAEMLGRNIGRLRAGQNPGLNTAGAIFSSLSLGMGLARNIMGASSEEYAAARDYQEQRRRLAEDRRNSMITYGEQGGGVNIGGGRRIDTSSLAGEYIDPLPRSMEDNANVEIEKGEYAIVPGVEGPMEARGEKHSSGGTKVNLPEAYIISDYRKIPDEFASQVRDTYKIKCTSKDSYASLIDKYKKKIGLKEAYDEQEKAIARLEKNSKIKDSNTAELNNSILSKYINENQTKINGMEEELRKFAEIVYKRQEADKQEEELRFFFREGGPVDASKLDKTAKALGIDHDEAKKIIFKAYKKRLAEMPNGGDTELARRQAEALKNIFNRNLRMRVVNVAGLDGLLNEGTGVNDNQGLQHIGQYGYGRVNENSVGNLLDVNRWGRYLNENGDFTDNTRRFQEEYQRRLNDFRALADTGIIENADDMRNFVDQYNFYGEDSTASGKNERPLNGNPAHFGSFEVDGMPGQTTLSRGFVSFDILNPGETEKLNKIDVKNLVDVRNNWDAVKKALGDSDTVGKLEQVINNEDLNGFDFVLADRSLDPVDPINPGVPRLPVSGLSEIEAPERIPVTPRQSTNVEDNTEGMSEHAGQDNSSDATRRRSYNYPGIQTIYPEILRDRQSGIITPGLERHYAPRVNPVLRSADQYINELNRATASQLDSIGDVPDSQRAAILANMNAVAGTNIARYINEVDLYNAQQRNEADRFNEVSFANTHSQNVRERQAYEAGTLQAMAINDENRARYYDNLNQEAMQKFNTDTTLRALQSIAPNMRLLPNGQVVYTDRGENVISYGDLSSPQIQAILAMYNQNKTATGGAKS